MTDIFDNTILCNKCGRKMQKANIQKNNYLFRAVVCPNCGEKIIHPFDEQEYNKFINLKNKEFNVKMRLVGNSYAVSIPKEIVSFMRAQEKMMDDMVRLCFEDMGRLSLNFNEMNHIKNEKQVRHLPPPTNSQFRTRIDNQLLSTTKSLAHPRNHENKIINIKLKK